MNFTMNTSFSKTRWKIKNSVKLPNVQLVENTNTTTQQTVNTFKNGMFNRIQLSPDCVNCKIYK